MMRRLIMMCLCVALSRRSAHAADHAADMAAGLKLFSTSVRAILTDHCLQCHGGEKVKSGLDLASRESLIKGGDHGPVLTPGDADGSALYRHVAHLDTPHMPYKKDKLPDASIKLIADWINLGAPYDKPLIENGAGARKEMIVHDSDRQFWSFVPLHPVDPPPVKHEKWVRTPIDRYALAQMESRGLEPNPIADRRTLIRRAYFDLIGMPPTPEEVEAFVASTDPDAYGKLIDRLLASPQYGERWAPYWLDVARFAESMGYEQDYDRPFAWHYRDFVIRAFNDDMPYDQFLKWQLAGDELAPRDEQAMVATGFLTAGAFPTQLTEKEFESARYDELDDMARATSEAMLGLTIGCARCHDHKYDPIPSRDYYRFAAVFTTAIRNDIDFSVAPDEDDAAQKAYDARHDAAEKARDDYAAGPMRQALIKWLANPANRAAARGAWLLPTIVSANSSGGATFKPQDDGSLLAEGPNAKDEHYTFVVTTPLKSIAELRIEALTDPSMVKGGPGRASNGNFALSDLKVSVKQLGGDQKPVAVKLTRARATHEQNQTGLSVASSLDDNPKTGWAVDFGGIGKPQAAVFDFEKPITFDDGAELTIEMDFRVNTSHNIGRPRLSVSGTTDAPVAVGDAGPPAEVAAALKQIDEGVTLDTLPDASREVLLAWFAPRDAQWSKLNAAVLECEKSAPKSHNEKIQITSEGLKPVKHHADDRGFPHFYPQTYLLKRGDVNQKTEVVEAGYLQVLERDGLDANHWRIAPPAGARTSYRRASLANWMTDVDHGAGHLAARVIVNRLWQHHLGRGIVATPNDFGVQGDRPTHPQLLEFLASDLIEHGWKLKRLQKLIMTSAVYMQSADSDSQRTQIDPTNLYLWRWSPRRLEAEAIRDTMLSVAGTLNSAMYGQGTLDENMTRRSVYFTIKRSKLIPTMMLFDWPEHLVSIGARASTTIAPQALMFMNSPQARTYATDFAQRVTKMSGDDAIGNAYRLAFNREPSKVERADAQAFINQQIASYQATKKADAPRLAMIDFCQALMGLNEFLYME